MKIIGITGGVGAGKSTVLNYLESRYGAKLILADLAHRLADKQLKIRVTDAAKQFIIDSGYDPVYGARPLKRFVQQRVETLVARKMISEDLAPGTELVIDYDGRDLTVSTEK